MISPVLRDLTEKVQSGAAPLELLAYAANLELVARADPRVAGAIAAELENQRTSLKLIASENYSSIAVQCAMGNLLTDKYAEGVPDKRYYPGCENVDVIESLARDRACALFGAEHAYVQPHSGSDANLVAFWTILSRRVELPALERLGLVNEKGIVDARRFGEMSQETWEGVRRELGNQALLALDFSCGGHLTHGYRQNVSGKMFRAFSYKVRPDSGLLDYDEIEALAKSVRPLILLAGYSAYPRRIDFARMRAIADAVGAVLMVDMAHFAGLVAGKVFTGRFDPVAWADVVTTTTHKTLRGPRGGLVLCKREFQEALDKGCPLVQGGPLPHVMAAKALCFAEAATPEFQAYAARIVANAEALAEALARGPVRVVTGGTENHLVLVDVTPAGLTGRQAEDALRSVGCTLNRNAIPYDPMPPLVTSGLRLGTPAVTSLGMGPEEMREVAAILEFVLAHARPAAIQSGANAGQASRVAFEMSREHAAAARTRVADLLGRFPVYPELDLELLKGLAGAART